MIMNETETKPKVTPADFFLYLGILITLYVSAVALITFLFAVVDTAFPNNQNIYFDATSPIAWSLSVFIVFYPVLIILLSTAMTGIIKKPIKANLSLRKWFIYLTLFITGLTIAIDLIVLINYFLKGEQLTTAFVLKVVSIILVSGVIFLFSFKDLKGDFISKPKLFKNFRIVASVVVALLIIVGLFLIGSPSKLRDANYDRERVQDLSSIQYQIIYFWQSKQRLPENLEELNDPLSGFELPLDPKTDVAYGYKILTDESFEICANFSTEQENIKDKLYITGFDHGVGNVCFERTIDPEKYPAINNGVIKDARIQPQEYRI